MNIIFILIIISYLSYLFFNRKKDEEKAQKSDFGKFIKENNKDNEYERHIITAALAFLFDEKKYRIKKIFLISEKNQRYSFWKMAGRNEMMIRKISVKK
jgi:hypothetical protein